MSRLIQFSFLMLFTELALIRYTSANFMFLAFFSNYILLASFLGIAVGFLRRQERISLFELSPILIAIVFYLCHYFHFEYQINIDPRIDDLNYYMQAFHNHVYPLFITLPSIFIAVMLVMASLAKGTADAFRKLSSLRAYQFEILGSLLGVIAFTVLAWFNMPPLAWALVIDALLLSLLISNQPIKKIWLMLQIPALILFTSVLYQESSDPLKVWSSYYKIVTQSYSQGRYAINVNGMPQQFVESVSQRHRYKPFYFYPYQHLSLKHPLDNVLIIGSGTGGDVAIALDQGAKHVDAVEIDASLADLGKFLNPNAPYKDPRVSLYINDGRAFLEQTPRKYDLIIIALADSVTLIARQSSVRLENYLLTLESMQAIREHLKPQGAFAMYNYYRTAWIVDRLGMTIQTAFQQAPCLDTAGDLNQWLSVLTVSPEADTLICKKYWAPHSASPPQPATDNHPFFYMEFDDISGMYFLCLGFILFTSIFAIKYSGGSTKAITQYFDLFLLGAAFLLLETKNIIQFALLFGATWQVNALVFIGILSTVYTSILMTQYKMSLPIKLLFTGLLLSLFICWQIPSHSLLQLNPSLRLFTASALAFTPILFANLIFAARFKATANATDAFAANMCGCIAGGLLEYSSLIIGYQNLLILVAILYFSAYAWMKLSQPKMIPTTINSGAST